MQIVIDIPKENYEDIINNGMAGSHLALLYKALASCTPLPDECVILTKEAYSDLCIMRAAGER